MFNWIHTGDTHILCAETGAVFKKRELVIQHYMSPNNRCDISYKTKELCDEAWDKLKAELGVR